MKLIQGKTSKPRKTLVYGQSFTGKSHFAAGAPDVLFLDIEDGLNDFETRKTPVLKTFGEVMDAIRWVYKNPEGIKTVVVDSADWLEKLIEDDCCNDANVESFAADVFGFGKGRSVVVPKWSKFVKGLDALRELGIHVVLLAHERVQKMTPPDAPGYERFVPALKDGQLATLTEWADEVFRLSFVVTTVTEDAGFNRTRRITSGDTDATRQCQTSPSAGVLAKNRLGMDSIIDNLTWTEYSSAIN